MTKEQEKEYYVLKIPKPKRLFKFLKKHAFILITGLLIILGDVFLYLFGLTVVKTIPSTPLKFTVSSHWLVGFFFGLLIVFFTVKYLRLVLKDRRTRR